MSERTRLLARIGLVFGLLAVCILVPGFFVWHHQEEQWLADQRADLESVTRGRATQVLAWRAERLADAAVIAQSTRLHVLLRSPQDHSAREGARSWLEFVRQAYHYRAVTFIGSNGSVLISVPADVDATRIRSDLIASIPAREPRSVMAGLYERDGEQLISVAAAILDPETRQQGTVLIDIPAQAHLEPFLTDPVPDSGTLHTFLFTGTGPELALLRTQSRANSRTHAGKPAEILARMQRSSPAALSAVRRLGGTSWVVVTTIERSEITGTRARRASTLLAVVIISLSLAAAAVRYSWQEERRRHYEQLYIAERDRAAVAERYRSLNRLANDAILLLDLDLRIVEANDRALELYGYAAEEMTGMDARQLRPDVPASFTDEFFPAIDTRGRRFETVHVRRDRTPISIEGSVRRIRTESGDFFHTVIRDVTEEKQQQRTIERLNWIHSLNTQVGTAVLRSRSLPELFQAVTGISLGDSGIRLAAVFLVDGVDGIRLVAHTGIPPEIVDSVSVRRDDDSLTATTVRLGQTRVLNNLNSEYSDAFRRVALDIGCHSLASTPLMRGGTIIGALTLGSAEPDFFHTPEQQLLENLGADLSYALDFIEREQARENAVAALRESEMLFHRLADSVAALIWIDDADSQCTYVNRRWSDFTGRPAREHLGAGWMEFLHPDDRPRFLAAYRRSRQEHVDFEVEYRLRRHDGMYRWVLDRGAAQFDGAGAFIGYIGAAIDITERRERDAALRLSDEHQRLALDVARAGTWELDPQTSSVRMSMRFKQIFGFREDEEPTLEQVRSRMHPDDRRRVVQAVDTAVQTSGEYEEEYRVVWPDGSIRWLLGRGRLVSADSRTPTKLVGVTLDVTARVQASERLAKAESAFQRIVATAHEGICEIDSEGAIRFATPRLAQLTGYRSPELASMQAQDLIHPDDRTLFVKCIRDARGFGSRCEVRLRRKDAEELWVSVWLSPINTVPELGDTKLAAIADITPRKRLEEQLMQASKMQAIGQLAGGVAHDFNNLLTVSLGYAQLAASVIGGSHPASDHIRQIIAASERGAALTRQLLVFSRHQVVQPQPIDINRVVADLEKMLGRLIGGNISIRSRFSPHLPLVHADRGQMEQVIMNLVVNARDAMPNGGIIDIETASVLVLDDSGEAPRKVHLRVRDSGVGMDAATRARIFEPFFTTKPKGRGTGLGLSTVYGIVTQASGKIEVTSEPNRGAIFDIYLPAASSSGSYETPKSASDVQGEETILVVEDDPALRALVEGALRQAGYTVLLAESGLSAFEVVSSYQGAVDLLLTDVMLPGMMGPEIATVIQGVRPGIAVLLMSGYTGDFDLEDLLAHGAEYIQKPFSLEELRVAVRKVLDARMRAPGRKRIIVADDDPAIRELLRLILEEAGYEIYDAENGAELTRKLKNEPFDLAITDIMMPEQDGIETLSALRAAGLETRVIVLSGGAGVYLQVAEKLGAKAILTKPVSPARLLKTVEQVLAAPARNSAAHDRGASVNPPLPG